MVSTKGEEKEEKTAVGEEGEEKIENRRRVRSKTFREFRDES